MVALPTISGSPFFSKTITYISSPQLTFLSAQLLPIDCYSDSFLSYCLEISQYFRKLFFFSCDLTKFLPRYF